MITVRTRPWILASFLVLAFGLAPAFPADDALVVKAKRIYTAAGTPIDDGMVLVEKGKIAAVGKNLKVPAGARTIQARIVIPGLIDAHTHLGVYSLPAVEENSDGNEMTNPVTPQVRALDSFNFDDPALKVGLAAGVTTIVSRPGSGNVIGGTSVAVKLKNARPDQMVMVPDCDLKMAIEGNPMGVYGPKKQIPVTMMGVYYLARKAFLDAQDYQKSWETYDKEKKEGKDPTPPKRDLGKENLLKALRREIPVHIHCVTASEVMTCIRLADEFNLRLSLGHCYWAYLIVDELKAHKDVHFNVGPPMFFTYFENHLEFRNCPAILAEAGLKVSLQTDALGGGEQNLRELAELCVRYGMKEDDALKAITLREAEAVGLEARIGSIEPGKDADLVCLDGEPFEFLTGVFGDNQTALDHLCRVYGFDAPRMFAHYQPVVPGTSLADRGRLKEGLPADITVFDGENIRDNTTLTEMNAAPAGVDYVFVNGKKIIGSGRKEKPLNAGVPLA